MSDKLYGHQGDVFFEYMSDQKLSKAAKEKLTPVGLDEYKTLTVVRGEATMHHHTIEHPEYVNIYSYESKAEKGITVFVAEVTKPTNLIHYHVGKKELTQEHNTIPLAPGLYRLGNQRIYESDNHRIMVNSD